MIIQRSAQFDQESEALFPPPPAAGEFGDYNDLDSKILTGTDWVLQHDPTYYPPVPGTTLRLIHIDAFADFPAMNIWYSFDGEWGCEYQSIEIDQTAYEAGLVDDLF